MAYYSGTATGHIDLFERIRTAALAQGWIDLYYDAGANWVGQGPGDSGTDEIIIQISLSSDVGAQKWHYQLRGASGYRPGASTLEYYVNPTATEYVSVWDSPMDYWLAVDGRRITWVSNVNGKYALGYVGLLRPFGTATQEPYPMFVGGTNTTETSHTLTTNSSFFIAPARSALLPGGVCSSSTTTFISPWTGWALATKIDTCVGGGHALYPSYVSTTYVTQTPHRAGLRTSNIGRIDGIYYVTGKDQALESVITVGGDTYICFPSFDKTATNQWFAFAQI